jgi:hypothetical protein
MQVLTPDQVRHIARSLEPPAERELRVHVLPFVAEQGSRARSRARAPLPLAEVLRRTRQHLPEVAFLPALAHLPDDAFWGSCFESFCRFVLPALPKISVVVTHGNFLRNEICKDACGAGVPNGGVVLLRRAGRMVFFVRHCLTCHNLWRTGDSALTMCYDFEALEPARLLVRALRAPVCSSAMPRSIVTAAALQRPVLERERLGLCDAFGACSTQR